MFLLCMVKTLKTNVPLVFLSIFGSSDKPSSWTAVDTALFLMTAGETKEDSALVGFTESKDKEVCCEH